ncbi:alpha/beta hydrolase [Pedobacter sp. L105]|uniref:alpha/beta hydrolase n=1 Tax=Pedobacter sp. L105 TaxID=1641871 RepID=UPI00131B4B7C|nr:alpha/beta hydrolase-fold protein [Pedobacter sp. L105]
MRSAMRKLMGSVILITLLSFSPGYSQVKSVSPSPFGEKEIVTWDYSSKVIGEDYTIYVHFPPGYDTTKTSYPVLYMTDGDWNMTVAMNCFRMLRQDYLTNEPLIVGIGYGNRTNKRSRDLEPSTGAPNFIKFIAQEVMPFIQSKYRVTDQKALYGYSYGGVFTSYVLFEHPGLFNDIFIGAPGNGDLTLRADKYFATHKELKGKIFLGAGSYEPGTVSKIEQFKQYMDQKKLPDLQVLTAVVPSAGHGAALAPVMQSGMKFVYCKTHKPFSLTESALKKFTGTFIAGGQNDSLTVYLDKGSLYLASRNGQPTQLVPYRVDGLFFYENEKIEINLKEEAGKKYYVINVDGEKPMQYNQIAGK